VVCAELGPPKGADAEHVRKNAAHYRGIVDAVNITDNQTAVARMSALAAAQIVKEEGLEPIFQLTTRDRNRLALQADVLGAAALGIHNILCLTGDHPLIGNHPEAKPVWDIDSVQLIEVVRRLRDEGLFMNGEEVEGRPHLLIGAAANPFAPPLEWRITRLEKKLLAGADFIQTQAIFDLERFEE
jgi:methylenetetrahydrofolate reductase (NADPH)